MIVQKIMEIVRGFDLSEAEVYADQLQNQSLLPFLYLSNLTPWASAIWLLTEL